MKDMGIIEVKSLTKKFKDRIVLDNVNLDIPEGKIIGIIFFLLSSHTASIGKKTNNMSIANKFSLAEESNNAWFFFSGLEKRRPFASNKALVYTLALNKIFFFFLTMIDIIITLFALLACQHADARFVILFLYK